MQLVITTRQADVLSSENDSYLPISYPKFPSMVTRGDTIFLGRYLVTGSEDSSLFLTVSPSPSQVLALALFAPHALLSLLRGCRVHRVSSKQGNGSHCVKCCKAWQWPRQIFRLRLE